MTRKTDINGEPLLFGGDGIFARNEMSVKTDLEQKLKVWKGECFYNRNLGVDYLNLLSTKDPNLKLLLENAVRDVARTVNNLLNITKLEIKIDYTKRTCGIYLEAVTVFGLINTNLELNNNYMMGE